MAFRPTPNTKLLLAAGLVGVCVCALVALVAPDAADAALRSAAGGSGGGGAGGFDRVVRYIDRISTYMIAVGGALAVLGMIYGGSQFMFGNPQAGRTLGLVAAGVIVVLASKGLTA